MAIPAQKIDERGDDSSNSPNLHCKFTPRTRTLIAEFALKFTHRQQRPQRENAQQKLCAFMRACMLAGQAGRISQGRLYEILTVLVWPGSDGPRFSRRCVDKWLGIFLNMGLLRYDDTHIVFSQWLPGWCPSQADLDNMHTLKRASTRRRVAKSRRRAQGLPEIAPESVDLPRVCEPVTHTMSSAAPKGVEPARHENLSDEYLSQHSTIPLNGFAHRARVEASRYDPCDAAESAELDAIAEIPWPDEAACPSASGPAALTRATRCEKQNVASGDAFKDALGAVEDGELAATLTRMRQLAPIDNAQGHAVPGLVVPARDTKPLVHVPSPAKPKVLVEKPRRFRPYPVMGADTIHRIMQDQGACAWEVRWGGCQRWALNEAVLIDTIDAVRLRIARGGVTSIGALFNTVLKRKARVWMRDISNT